MRGELESALGSDLSPKSSTPPSEPAGFAPTSPYRTALGVFFWVLGIGGGLVAIIAWFVDTQGLLWFELGRAAAGFGITCGVLWLVVSALTWRPRE